MAKEESKWRIEKDFYIILYEKFYWRNKLGLLCTLLKIMLYVDYTLPNSSIIPEKSLANVNITIKITLLLCTFLQRINFSLYAYLKREKK